MKSTDFVTDYFKQIKQALDDIDQTQIYTIVKLLFEAYRKNRQIFIIGNGGSAATASHFAADLSKGTLKRVYDLHEARFRVISLTDNMAYFSALANDLSYEDVFIQQLRNLINSKDLLIVISGSGNSPNIIKALEYARRRKAVTIGLLGFKTGGKAARLTDVPLSVNNTKYGPCEDVHLILAHIITSLLSLQKEHHD